MRAVDRWLLKKAKGFYYREVTDEYQEVDGELKLVRRKINKKYMPPDVGAIKAAGDNERGLGEYSDTELLRLRDELIAKRGKNESDPSIAEGEM